MILSDWATKVTDEVRHHQMQPEKSCPKYQHIVGHTVSHHCSGQSRGLLWSVWERQLTAQPLSERTNTISSQIFFLRFLPRLFPPSYNFFFLFYHYKVIVILVSWTLHGILVIPPQRGHCQSTQRYKNGNKYFKDVGQLEYQDRLNTLRFFNVGTRRL